MSTLKLDRIIRLATKDVVLPSEEFGCVLLTEPGAPAVLCSWREGGGATGTRVLLHPGEHSRAWP